MPLQPSGNTIQSSIDKLHTLSDQQLIEAFNREVGNPGWTTSRARYLPALRQEFMAREFDYSAIGGETNFSFKNKVKLVGKKIEWDGRIIFRPAIPGRAYILMGTKLPKEKK